VTKPRLLSSKAVAFLDPLQKESRSLRESNDSVLSSGVNSMTAILLEVFCPEDQFRIKTVFDQVLTVRFSIKIVSYLGDEADISSRRFEATA